MRKLLLLSCLIVHSCLWAQYTLCASNSEEFDQFLHSPLTVQLTGCQEYDASLKEAIKSHWHQTPVIYATDTATLEAAASTLRYVKIEIIKDGGVLRGVVYGWTLRYQNGLNMDKDPGKKGVIALVETNCGYMEHGFDCYDAEDCRYRINVTVAQLNEMVDFLKANTYKGTSWSSVYGYPSAFNRTRDAALCGSRTLLVDRKIFNHRVTEEDFKKAYTHPCEVLDHNEYVKMIADGNTAYNYLMLDLGVRPTLAVFDPEQDRTLYLDRLYHVPLGDAAYTLDLNRAYLEDLVKAVDN
ncbi:MAG: hypothetical protein ABI373_01155 [Flavobacteriales bacterium]